MRKSSLQPLRHALKRHQGLLLWAVPLGIAALYVAVVIARDPLLLSQDRPTLTPDSYNGIVADMIEQGLIVPNPLAQQDGADPALAPVMLSAQARARKDVSRFVTSSYLRADLAANDGRWTLAGGRVAALDSWVHTLRRPVTGETAWTGILSYRPVEGSNRPQISLTSQESGKSFALGEGSANRALNTVSWIDVATGERSGGLDRHVDFVDRSGGKMDSVATFTLIGETPVLGVRCGEMRRVQVVLASFRHPPGPCADRGSGDVYLVLAPGDAVSFPRPPLPSSLRFVVSGGLAGLSAPRPFGVRQNSAAAGGLAGQVAITMDQILTDPKWRGQVKPDRDIVTTLVRPIQDMLDVEFPKATKNLADALNRRADDPVIGAAVVMDTLSGDVLGLGSVTRPPREQDPFGTTNQAFVVMAAGSTAKVPVAAAILSRFPTLRQMCAHPSSPGPDGKVTFDRVLGIQLEAANLDTVTQPDPLNFIAFIRESSNRYAAQLLLLASIRTEPRGSFRPLRSNPPKALVRQDQYALSESCNNAAWIADRPAVVFPWVLNSNGRPTDLMRLSGFGVFSGLGPDNWIDRLYLDFDMPMGQPGISASPFVTDIWDRNENSFFADRAFDAISPQREDFRFGAMQDLRGDYLQVILGGGNAGWSTVKLAEAYSRVVSGTKVEMRLRLPEAGNRNPPDPLPRLSRESRAVLLQGMREVASDGSAERVLGGKLRALALKVVDGEQWILYAKTGTPGSETRDRSPINDTITRLAAAGVIGFAQGRIAVRTNSGEAEPRALARQMENLGYPASPVALRDIQGWIVRENGRVGRLNSLVRNDGQGGMQIVADIAAARDRRVEIDENAVVAVVLARYCRPAVGTLRLEQVAPHRAVTLTVNIAARKRGVGERSGENSALRFAGDTLLAPDGPVIDYLRGGIPCGG